MMYRYTTKQGLFETNYKFKIPWDELHSLNDEPAFEDLSIGSKGWCFEGKWHRETGPAKTWANGTYSFWLNGIWYENINDWLEHHPNQDKAFQVMMILQYS